MAFSPNGDLFTVESDGGLVRAFRLDASGTKPEKSEVFVSGLDRPYGIAFYPPSGEPAYVYVATASRVLRYPYKTGATAPLGPVETVVAKLSSGAGHWTRDIVFSPDGRKLFAAVGSRSNDAEDESRPSKEEVAALEAKSGVGPRAARRDAAPTCWSSRPMGAAKRFLRRACATAPASRSGRRATNSGASSMSATGSATIFRLIMRRK